MLLYYSPTFLEHETGQHPENPRRIVQAAWRLLNADVAARFVRPAWQPITMERLVRVHSADYLETVRQYAAAGGGQIEADTVVSPRSFEVARLAAGAACDAVE